MSNSLIKALEEVFLCILSKSPEQLDTKLLYFGNDGFVTDLFTNR